MSGALGLDLDASKLSSEECKLVAGAVALYKRELRDIVLFGELYRLESPYVGPRAALDFISEDRSRAVLFVYQLKASKGEPVRLRGLDPQKRYRVREVNLAAGTSSGLQLNGQTIDGSVLMRDGLLPPVDSEFSSSIVELTSLVGK
jgi:alpha-galactosidase